MEPIIRVTGLRKVYKVGREKVVALDHIDLEIEKGEICCILGASGSGKSTLLNMLAGLEKPSRGDIFINGVNVNKLSEKRLAKFRQKFIGFIFQSYNLIPTLTAQENVALPLVFRGTGARKRNLLAKRMLGEVMLSTHIKHKPTQMSGGQQQRVSIARAFVARPAVIFADEPTGNLDSKTSEEVMKLILQIARDNSQTLIIVTHDVDIAGYADRIINIKDGRVLSDERREGRGHTHAGEDTGQPDGPGQPGDSRPAAGVI